MMACSNTCSLVSPRRSSFFNNGSSTSLKKQSHVNNTSFLFRIRASEIDPDCNDEDCAPDKEVGKVSLEWLAGEKTKVVGTFPPRRKWSGYVEKDTAGQTNIYSIEPAIYVAESAISSGSAGSSSDGAENTAAISAFLGLISIAAASAILLQVGKNSPPPQVKTIDYNGPSLSYYITKFKPAEIIEASVPIPTEPAPSVQAEETSASAEETSASAEVSELFQFFKDE